MTPERLAKIREALAAITTHRPPPTAYAERDRARDRWTLNSSDYAAELLAEVDRLVKAQDRVWAIVGQRREAAKAAGLDPYADPIAQALAAALTDSPEPSDYARAINAPLSPEAIAALNRELTSGDPARYTRTVRTRTNAHPAATMAADMCPRCKGDNAEDWALCAACADATGQHDTQGES